MSLKREVAVCKGQTVACMTTVRYHTKNAQHRMEVWMGSGSDDVSGGQVSWADVTDSGSEVCVSDRLIVFLEVFPDVIIYYMHYISHEYQVIKCK